MRVLTVRNVEEAWHQGVALLHHEGVMESSRAGVVLAHPGPVTTVYKRPWERVLLCPARRANPFFHLMESMWMLAGRSDARWLDQFVHDFSSRFAERGGHIHGAYGHRWRRSFLLGSGSTRDQLAMIAEMLRADPTTRRAVLAMWSPERDLGRSLRDHPCNTHAYFRVRTAIRPDPLHTLDMMTVARSHDIVWGAYGANAVHMSVMHEYVAAMAGMQQGEMTQVSWNWHAYLEVFDRIVRRGVDPQHHYKNAVVVSEPLFQRASVGDVYDELEEWLASPLDYVSERNPQLFDHLLVPMMRTHHMWHVEHDESAALALTQTIRPTDWRLAAQNWLTWRYNHDRILQLPKTRSEDSPDSGAASGEDQEAGGDRAEELAAPATGAVETGPNEGRQGGPAQ